MTSQNIRNAVKAVLIKDNFILLIKHKNENVYYTLPGGGINHNESIYDALRRECLEEVGAKIKVLDLIFLTEYIADEDINTIQKKGFHQIDMYFQCEIIGELDINLATEQDDTQIGYEWINVCMLENINFYPKSLKERIMKRGLGDSKEIFIFDK